MDSIPRYSITSVLPTEYPRVVEVWEASVRATHHFITEADIAFFLPHVREGLPRFEVLACTRDADGRVSAFIGLDGQDISALFVDPAWRGKGIGRVRYQRGPIVFCLEGVDHGNIHLDQISINPKDIQGFKVTYMPDLLGGVPVLEGQGKVIEDEAWGGGLYSSEGPRERDIKITAIPYCTWDNREQGEMRVWLRGR